MHVKYGESKIITTDVEVPINNEEKSSRDKIRNEV